MCKKVIIILRSISFHIWTFDNIFIAHDFERRNIQHTTYGKIGLPRPAIIRFLIECVLKNYFISQMKNMLWVIK